MWFPEKEGSEFLKSKINEFRLAINNQIESGGKSTKLMIDGGVKHHNVALVKSWGIDVAVIGSGIINDNGTVADNLKEITSAM